MDFKKFLSYAVFLIANHDLIKSMAVDLIERYHGDNPMASTSGINNGTIQELATSYPELAEAASREDGPGIARNVAQGVFGDLVNAIISNPQFFLILLDRFFPQSTQPSDDGSGDTVVEDDANDGGGDMSTPESGGSTSTEG